MRVIINIILLILAYLVLLFVVKKPSQKHTDSVKTEYTKERDIYRQKRRGPYSSNILKKSRKEFAEISNIAINQRSAGIMGWDAIGPFNVGGRIRAISVHPTNSNILHVGAAAGGIWRSTNRGITWNLTTDHLSSYPITSIVHDQSNPSIMYASTGEFNGGGPDFTGTGILKSTDTGTSWQILSTLGSGDIRLNKIIINPLRSESLISIGSRNGVDRIFKSHNGGDTWTSSSPFLNHISDIEINPSDTTEIIIGTQRNAFISRDGGVSYSSLIGNNPLVTTLASQFGRRCEVQYCAFDPSTIYISRFLVNDSDNNGLVDGVTTTLWRSSDSGNSWNQEFSRTSGFPSQSGNETINPLNTQGSYSHSLWVDPYDCDRVLLGGINLWKWHSSNNWAGTSSQLSMISRWQDDIGGNSQGNNNSLHADFHFIALSTDVTNNDDYEIWLANDGGIYKSNDLWSASQNNGWLNRSNGLNITQLYGAEAEGLQIVGGSQDNSWFNTFSNNNTFFTCTTGDGGYCGIDPDDSNFVFGTTQNGSVYRSSDGGQSYCNIFRASGNSQFGACDNNCTNFTIINDTVDFIAPFKIVDNSTNSNFLILGTDNVWGSLNRGDTWFNMGPYNIGTTVSALEWSNNQSFYIYAGYLNGRVFRRSGSGTFSEIGSGVFPNRPVTDIAVSAVDNNRIAISFGGFATNNVFITTNGGSSWQSYSLPIQTHIETIVWHPIELDWLYVGTDVGIFASENSGIDWNVKPLFSQNEGPVYVRVQELFWDQGHLYSATHGRGIWKTTHQVFKKIYVNKDWNPPIPLPSNGSIGFPYTNFMDALEHAGNGSEIIFLSSGDHEEIPSLTQKHLIEKRIKITLQNGNNSVILK